MPEKNEPEKLHGWDNIARHLDCSPKTARKRESSEGLPVYEDGGGQVRRRVWAYSHELDRWKEKRYDLQAVQPLEPAAAHSGQNISQESPDATPRSRRSGTAAITVAILTMLALISIRIYTNASSAKRLNLTAPKQLTSNGREKFGLISYGNQLYFGQELDGWLALAEMPASGGPVRVLWSPLANLRPIDISPDGRQLLATASQGVERERELWTVPLGGGTPQRVPNITAHAAAWSPDGKTIAIAAANDLYLYSIGQDQPPRRIASLKSVPRKVFWTADGLHLQFLLADPVTDRTTEWGDLTGMDSPTITLHHLTAAVRSSDLWSKFADWHSYLFPQADEDLTDTTIYSVNSSTTWGQPRIEIRAVASIPGEASGVTFNPAQSKLVVLSQPSPRTSFVRYDLRTHSYRSILPGVSGVFLDYSRDGAWVAYSSFGQNSLWISRADGRDARQLTFPPESVELPRWSPDGKEIAYMSQRPGEPWRIRIWHMGSGTISDAAKGDDNQGAPTWSKDGRSIAYGSVMCEATHTCAIRKIHIATGQVETVPGSEGLFTARWSPDGRWIAAIDLDRHRLMVLNVTSGIWHPLADSVYSPDLSWSSDSRYLYLCVPGSRARIDRVEVDTGRSESVMDLFSEDRLDLTETADLQFSLAPDSSIVVQRRIHSQEVYAYDIGRN